MRHEQLWAPWRLAYVQGADQEREVPTSDLKFLPGADESCFLCRYVADVVNPQADRENHVVERGPHAMVVLNRYPYNNGHLLVAPLAHKGRLDELTAEEQLEIHEAITRYVGRLESLLKSHGFNIGLNLGQAAGAGLVGHLHWHVVPRWSGDTNFMGVVGGVEIIAQSLDSLWEYLSKADE